MESFFEALTQTVPEESTLPEELDLEAVAERMEDLWQRSVQDMAQGRVVMLTMKEEKSAQRFELDDSKLWALVRGAHARREALGIEEPPFDPEAAVQRLRDEMKAYGLDWTLEQHYILVIEPDPTNGYWALCPALGDCQARGETREEAKAKLVEQIRERLQELQAQGKPLPVERGAVELLPVSECVP